MRLCMRLNLIYFFPITLLISLIIGGCNEELYDASDEAKALVYIRKAYQNGLHTKAIESARMFQLKHPYTNANMEVDLLIADSYFQMQEYLEAAIHYERFVKLYPKHPKKPFALFRIGMTHWQQAPKAIDRDQAFTEKALKVWKDLVENHPESSEAATVKSNIKEGDLRLLGSKKFIASFYCRQKIWHSCAQKATEIVKEFSHYPSYKKNALQLMEKSYREMARLKRKEEAGTTKLEKNAYFRKYSSRELDQMADEARKELAGL